MTQEPSLDRVSELLVRAEREIAISTDMLDLYNRICDVVVGIGGYCLAWIGLAENDTGKTVRPVAYSGFNSDYMESINISWADVPSGRGPTGISIRTGQSQLVNAIATDPSVRQWRKLALDRGYSACLSLPLLDKTSSFGALVILAREAERFSPDDVQALETLAAKVSTAMVALRHKHMQQLQRQP
jgi:GAF domain-containing protein